MKTIYTLALIAAGMLATGCAGVPGIFVAACIVAAAVHRATFSRWAEFNQTGENTAGPL